MPVPHRYMPFPVTTLSTLKVDHFNYLPKTSKHDNFDIHSEFEVIQASLELK